MGVGEPWYLCRRSKVMLWWKRPRPPSKYPIEGVEGVAPEPSSLRETTIENEGCRTTPLHLWRRPQEPDIFGQRKEQAVGNQQPSLWTPEAEFNAGPVFDADRLCPHRHQESEDELCQNYILQYV